MSDDAFGFWSGNPGFFEYSPPDGMRCLKRGLTHADPECRLVQINLIQRDAERVGAKRLAVVASRLFFDPTRRRSRPEFEPYCGPLHLVLELASPQLPTLDYDPTSAFAKRLKMQLRNPSASEAIRMFAELKHGDVKGVFNLYCHFARDRHHLEALAVRVSGNAISDAEPRRPVMVLNYC